MPLQMIELNEVQVIEIGDDALEVAGKFQMCASYIGACVTYSSTCGWNCSV